MSRIKFTVFSPGLPLEQIHERTQEESILRMVRLSELAYEHSRTTQIG